MIKCAWRCPLGAVVLVMVVASAAVASPGSDELVERGAAELKAGNAEAALALFDRAAAADRNDPQAAFFRGATLNRLGRPAEARTALERAVHLRTANPDIDFELGWALLNTGQTDAAIERLERYTAKHPDHGQAAEFLGRAYLANGDLDRAEAKLDEAVALDPQLQPTVEISRMLIAERRGDFHASAGHAESVMDELGSTQAGRLFRNRLRGAGAPPVTATQIPGGKPWRVVLGLGFGYTDNVIAASDDVPLPTDISGTDSAAGRFSTLVSYDLVRNDRYRLQAGYAFAADEYEAQFDTSDYKSHLWYLDYTRSLNATTTLNFRLADEYLNVGGSSLRNSISARPAITFAVRPELAVELSYTFAAAEYYFPTTAVTDRDGLVHTIGATAYWRLPDTQLTGRTGVFVSISDADGSDYDSVTTGGFISIAHPLVLGIDGSLTYSRLNGSYDSPNSFAAFAIKRDDDTDILSAELTRPIDLPGIEERSARLYLRYDYTDNDSNVAVFRYDQYVISGGIVIEF